MKQNQKDQGTLRLSLMFELGCSDREVPVNPPTTALLSSAGVPVPGSTVQTAGYASKILPFNNDMLARSPVTCGSQT